MPQKEADAGVCNFARSRSVFNSPLKDSPVAASSQLLWLLHEQLPNCCGG